MKKSEFIDYVNAGYTRIPVSCELHADLDTPLSAFVKLANRPRTFLFESMQGGEKWGRYSIIGLPCEKRIEVRGNIISMYEGEACVETFEVADPLDWIEAYQTRYQPPEIAGLPRITGGLVGYFGYDTIRYIEPRLGENKAADPIDTPDVLLLICDELCVFDNISGKLIVIVLADPGEDPATAFSVANNRLVSISEQLRHPTVYRAAGGQRDVQEADFESGFTEASYKQAVDRIKQYITEGDCMQVVLSQRLSIDFDASPLDLYRGLRALNPSPYMFYLNLGDHHVVGSSPEILVRYEQGEVTVRPLAGTRPRGADEAEDQRLESELLADPKEIAEHLMLIDLGRNDIGRIAQTGSVTVSDRMDIERYSHVMHIVSNVVGKLKDGLSPMDVIRATFPAGTLSGAPKVRAMEIIQELEPVKRGIYGGSIGYLSWNGNMDTCIAIRTAVIKNRQLHIQAGAGIVYDSVPQTEWDETMNKARAMFRAVALAEQGLDRPPVEALANAKGEPAQVEGPSDGDTA